MSWLAMWERLELPAMPDVLETGHGELLLLSGMFQA